MGKQLFIAEKPSVAAEFAKALKVNGGRRDGYLESDQYVVTWCVGHLITMSYPEVYDPALKKWSLNTIPFFPEEWKYEVIGSVKKQFAIVKGLLNRADVDTIYICTDSGREGEYIYRLVDQMAGVKNKKRLRVWIDSQTEEEILRGIREAKDWSFYDHLSDSAYLRAKEDYLMGINFSRALTLKFGPAVASFMNTKWSVISVGRVMTCVLGMVVRREREIRSFVKTPFYRVIISLPVAQEENKGTIEAEWRSVEGSKYFQSPKLYKENGFLKRETAQELINYLEAPLNPEEKKPDCTLIKIEKKKEQKQPPLLFNLAELQNTCSRRFKISPDETLKIVQELYEKKMVTYPRTDARVLSTAVAKEISKNIRGLSNFAPVGSFAQEILSQDAWKTIAKTRYTNDKQITDHYAIIPTGQGLGAYERLSGVAKGVYEVICRRFLSIFYGPAVYKKYALEFQVKTEHFFTSYRMLEDPGYLKVTGLPQESTAQKEGEEEFAVDETSFLSRILSGLKKGMLFEETSYAVKEGEYRQVMFLEFMIHLNRAVRKNRLEYIDTVNCNEKVLAILDYVGEHLCENLSIDLIAGQFYISKYYMMRLFKQETGYTLGQYISQKRLLLAKELLSSGVPGTQVCYDCGFKDYSTFSRAYKQLFGVTPSGRTCP